MLQQVRTNPATRPSSPTDPAEWNITEDGYRFAEGDRVFNYYDGEWVTVLEDPSAAAFGWFLVATGPYARQYTLNSTRVSAKAPAHR